SDATDIYYLAWAIFTFAGSLIFSAYQDSALIPILAEVRIADRALLPVVTGSLLAHTLAWGGALAAAIGAAALAWFRYRYEGTAFATAALMVGPFAVYLVALSVKTFLSAVLNAEHRFFAYPVASAAGALTALAVIAGLR